MITRVKLATDADGPVIYISPRDGRVVSLVGVFGSVGIIVNEFVASDRRPPEIGHPLAAFAMIWLIFFGLIVAFSLWVFLGKQRIRISASEILIDKIIWSTRVGEVRSFPAELISGVEMREREYRVKGKKGIDRTIFFLLKDGGVERLTQLSKKDGEILLDGPFKVFRK
jgi:hypothetical protein